MIEQKQPPMPEALRAIVTGDGWERSKWAPLYVCHPGIALIQVRCDQNSHRWELAWLMTKSDGVTVTQLRELADLLERIEQAIGSES